MTNALLYFIHHFKLSLMHTLVIIMISDAKTKPLTKFYFNMCDIDSDEIVMRDTHIREWKLVYSPSPSVFDELADLAAKSLQLEGAVGVNSSEELEAAMFNQELVAGIDFQHSQVISSSKILSSAAKF